LGCQPRAEARIQAVHLPQRLNAAPPKSSAHYFFASLLTITASLPHDNPEATPITAAGATQARLDQIRQPRHLGHDQHLQQRGRVATLPEIVMRLASQRMLLRQRVERRSRCKAAALARIALVGMGTVSGSLRRANFRWADLSSGNLKEEKAATTSRPTNHTT